MPAGKVADLEIHQARLDRLSVLEMAQEGNASGPSR